MSEATDFMRLAADHVSDCLDQDGQARLAHVVEADPAACKALADQVVVDCMLRREALQTIDVDKIMRDVLRSEIPKRNSESSLPTIDVDKIMRAVLRSEIPTVQRTHPAPATVKRPKSSRSLRKFSALPKLRRSSGRSPWLSSLAAVLIVSCVLAMTVTYMNRDAANRGDIAATVQDGNGAIWGQPPRVPGSNRIVRNTLDLRAGIAEISFATGATVIIEGPTVIELTGPNQAQLSLGRASAYVPPPASGFILVSEGLTAVDRGTAFGLSRSADKRVELHVFSGAVEAQSPAASASLMVNADSAVQRDLQTGALTAIPCRPFYFFRALHSPVLILDVADLVAGGDGRGSAVADGIDPDTGELVSSPSITTRAGNGQYQRVKRAPAIDGVFVPNGDQVITSQGHRFAFPPTDGKAFDIIRRGGIKADHNIPAIFDGVNYQTPEHTVLGMHANSGFTIDLTTIAQKHPGMLVERLTARVANFHMNTSAHFWVIIDGVLVKHFRDLNSKKVAEHIDVLIPVGSRFLTFVSTDSSKDSNFLWVNVGDPKLRLRSIP